MISRLAAARDDTLPPAALPAAVQDYRGRISRFERLSPFPRWQGEGRGEGRFLEFRQEPLENAVQIFDDILFQMRITR
jgi:hypothetical protein